MYPFFDRHRPLRTFPLHVRPSKPFSQPTAVWNAFIGCSGSKFYHWGALNGLIGLVEEGFW